LKYQVTQADKVALLEVLKESLHEQEVLAKHTSFRIGGLADFFARVTSEETMLAVLKTCRIRNIPVLLLGNGTNILISDLGWRGLVIENRLTSVVLTELPDGTALLKAGSGAVLGGVARKVAKDGWSGFEFAATIPGSVGGGVVNNAGAHGGDFSQVMTRVAVATMAGERKEYTPADFEVLFRILQPSEMRLAYRHSRWREQVGMHKVPSGDEGNEVILWAEFHLHRGNSTEIKAHIDEMTDWRRAKQPQEPNAGSIFKNPPAPNPAAGRLIEAAGLKGTKVGGAQISPKHANFIVNVGGATAADVMSLIQLVKQKVREQSGVELELEVELLGEWPPE
jgi:UDP-N-acetylmuramate dehydrogenase